jgi:hypothetical protein
MIPDIPVSGNALARLKVLWGYLRTNLSATYMQSNIMKSTNIKNFFSAFFIASDTLRADLLS